MEKIEIHIRMSKTLTVSESNRSGEHWTKKKKRHDYQKIIVNASLHDYKAFIKLPCSIKMIRIAPRKLDYDNLICSFKWIRDTIANALIPGLKTGRADDDTRLNWEYQQEKGKPKEYAIRLEIYF